MTRVATFRGVCGNCDTETTLSLEPDHKEEIAGGLRSIELQCICGDKVFVRRLADQ